jgi:hypothetical protein
MLGLSTRDQVQELIKMGELTFAPGCNVASQKPWDQVQLRAG